MRLHALQRMYEQPSPLKVDRPALRENVAFDLTRRPKLMIHLPPRILRIGAKVARAILAHDESRRRLREFQIHNPLLIESRLDRIALPILADLHRAPIRLEVMLVFREREIRDVVRGPYMRLVGIRRDDLRAELCGGADVPAWTRNSQDNRFLSGQEEYCPYITLLYMICANPMCPLSLVM